MIEKSKVICTIGPSSNNKDVLSKLADREVDFFRVNLSHTDEDQIEQRIKDLLGYGIPIILDTEGSQVRSGNNEEVFIDAGSIIKLHSKKVVCDSKNIFLNPEEVVNILEEGDLVSIDFNSLLLRVFDVSKRNEGYILCKAVIGGQMGGRKAVQIDNMFFSLPAFSKKDYTAINLAKKYGIRHFTLSFMENPNSVLIFKQNYPEAIVYSKIESKKGLDNFMEIAKNSEGILIDRGDLSSQVPLEKIPFVQKHIIKKVREINKEVFVATNTLEQMAFSLKPSKAEANDIINTLIDGATGIALTKETAVGKYPVETVNMLKNLISQVDFLEGKAEKDYIFGEDFPELLIKPHGGVLVNRFNPNYQGEIPEKKVEVNEETRMDAEQIALGAFSPIEGFMNKEEFNSVTSKMRLPNGIVWPIPITIQVSKEVVDSIGLDKEVALTNRGETFAILKLEDVYSIDKEDSCIKIFGSKDISHPGVAKFLNSENFFLGGKVILLKRRESEYKVHEITPKQTRKIFSERGWSKVLGFHTRNVPHRSHEFIQVEGMKKGFCDGLFIHPVIGKKKKGDFEARIIIESYEKMLEKIYDPSKILFGTFVNYSRYAGPREALFTALVRKNFGCSHFLVGRDHTGVGDFYSPDSSQKIFDEFDTKELGIVPIKFGNILYSVIEEKYVHERDLVNPNHEGLVSISGTEARSIIRQGKPLPEWYMRAEISELLLDKISKNEKVFVE